jgi:PAS domain S-box-containing protein
MSLSFWDDKIPPEDLKILKENEEYALKNQLEFYINEYRFKKRDQNWAYVRSRIYLLYDNNKTVLSMIGAMEDVTNQRLSQKALFESEKNYRMLFDSAPLPTLISDTETLKYIDVNQAASIHFGYTREEFLNMSIFDLRPKEEHENLFHFMAQLDENDSHHTKKFLLVKKSGELIHTEVSASVIQYKGKKAFFATVKDVTENIKLQEELMQERISQEKSITKTIIDTQEKERSEIGKELHDNVNQILTTIKLYIENIKAYPEHSTAFIEKGVLLTQRAINEIRYLAKQLVTPVMADLGFEATLDELVVHFKALNTFEIDFCFDIEEKQIDKGLQLIIYRIVQEQLNNVVKYARASRVKIHIKKGKRQIHLLIEDNGIGFDPTETNFGLGLRNIKNRAELYRGVVHLRSAKGEGCTLIVDFPWD